MCEVGKTTAKFCKNHFYYRDKSNVAPECFREDLETYLTDLTEKQPHLNVLNFNLVFDNFVAIISETINQHAPLKRLSRKKCKLVTKPWITKGVYKSIRRKRIMFKPHFMNGSTNEKNFYRKYTN